MDIVNLHGAHRAWPATGAGVLALATVVLVVSLLGSSDGSEANGPGSGLTRLQVDDDVASDLDDLVQAVFELRSTAFEEGDGPATTAARSALLDEFGTSADSERTVRISSPGLDAVLDDAVELHDLEEYGPGDGTGSAIVSAEVDVTDAFPYLLHDEDPTLFVVAAESWTWNDGTEPVDSGQTRHWDAPFTEQGDVWVVGQLEPEPDGFERH